MLQPDVVAYIDVFTLAQSNFEEWLRVWRMDVSERYICYLAAGRSVLGKTVPEVLSFILIYYALHEKKLQEDFLF